MESKTKNKKSREVLNKMVKRSFPGFAIASDDSAVQEMKEGWFNVAYSIRLTDNREVVLKIAPPAEAETLTYEKNIMNSEVSMMQLIRNQTDVKVPEIYFYDDTKDICDSDYFFMEKLEGANFENTKHSMIDTEIYKLGYEKGVICQKMSELTGTYFGYPGHAGLQGSCWKDVFLSMIQSVLTDGKKKHADLGISYETLWELILKHADSLSPVTIPRFVHWDLWDSNVFVKNGEITGIFDFERALWGDPLMESIFVMDNQDTVAFMDGYGKHEFCKDEEIRRRLYGLYLFLIMAVESYYREYDTDEVYKIAISLIASTVQWMRKNDELHNESF